MLFGFSGSDRQQVAGNSVGKLVLKTQVLSHLSGFAKQLESTNNDSHVCCQAPTCSGLTHSPLLQRRSSMGCLWTIKDLRFQLFKYCSVKVNMIFGSECAQEIHHLQVFIQAGRPRHRCQSPVRYLQHGYGIDC